MGHDSDCAVHSEPAYPAGECNCSACDELHKLRADLAAARREIAAIKTRFEHECSDVDRIVQAIGLVTAPRTECGSLRVNDIVQHVKETLDALATAHSASVDFSNKYAAAQMECVIRKEYAESLVRIVGGKYLFSKERFGVSNKTTLALSHLIDEIDKAERRVAELLAQEGGK